MTLMIIIELFRAFMLEHTLLVVSVARIGAELAFILHITEQIKVELNTL